MEDIAVEYFPTSIDTGKNEEKSEFHSYIRDDNEQDACDSHAHMVHLLKIPLESVRLVSGMTTTWEDNDGCENQFRCALAIYLMISDPDRFLRRCFTAPSIFSSVGTKSSTGDGFREMEMFVPEDGT